MGDFAILESKTATLRIAPSQSDNGITTVLYPPGNHPPIYCRTDQIHKNEQLLNYQAEKEAIKRFSEKYDSLNRLRRSQTTDGQGLNIGNTIASTPQTNHRTSTGMSDGAASDISDVNPSNASTVSSLGLPGDPLTDQELYQVEMFYKSHKSHVHVCQCMANLYFRSTRSAIEDTSSWELSGTGIPVLLLDSGDHRRKRKLFIILAERGTGFVLWKDMFDTFTKYTAPHTNFHTLHPSTDHSKQAGLSFDDTGCATDFHNTLQNMTSDPEDNLLKLSSRSSKKNNVKKKEKSKPKKYKSPKKSEISQPCCFQHVTKLERPGIPFADDDDLPETAFTGDSEEEKTLVGYDGNMMALNIPPPSS